MASFFQQWKANLLVPAVPVTWAALSLLGVVAGPFGTNQVFSAGARLLFWPGLIAVSILLGAAVRTLVESVLGLRHFATQAPVLALIVTVPLAPFIHAVVSALAVPGEIVVPGIGRIAVIVFAASICVSAIRHAVVLRRDGAAPLEPGAMPRLFARISSDLHAPLLRLSVRDHYVDVVTEAGTASILIRFGDAIAEVEGVAGAQVHRSHWVAAVAIERAENGQGKLDLHLVDGTRVPVSKTYRAAALAMLAAHERDRARPA